MFTEKERTFTYSGEKLGSAIVLLDSAASTNEVALKTASKASRPDGIVVAADMQTHGRGRMGRPWISPPGCNLYTTVVLSPPVPPADMSLLSLAVPVAAVKAIRSTAGLETTIKWPNDIVTKDRKCGGILIEMKTAARGTLLIAVGIGINVNMPQESFPPEISHLATSLMAEKGAPVNRMHLLKAVLKELESAYKFLLNGNKGTIIHDWIALNSTLGRSVTVEGHDRTISGTAHSVNERGELVIRLASGACETVRAGDVTVQKGPHDQKETDDTAG